jgi:hypothetical protein
MFKISRKKIIDKIIGKNRSGKLHESMMNDPKVDLGVFMITALIIISLTWLLFSVSTSIFKYTNNRVSIEQAVILNDKIEAIRKENVALKQALAEQRADMTLLIDNNEIMLQTLADEVDELKQKVKKLEKSKKPVARSSVTPKTVNVTELPKAEIINLVSKEVLKYNFVNPADATKLITAIYNVESNFRVSVINKKSRATGLAQIIPLTGKDIHTRILKRKTPYTHTMMLNPHKNIEYSVAYVSERLNAHKGNVYNTMKQYSGSRQHADAKVYTAKLNKYLEQTYGTNIYKLNLAKIENRET